MYFYKKKGKPHLDARGNLILSKNDSLAAHSSPSAGPRVMDNATYCMLKGAGFWAKCRATVRALNWIWSK